jgi:hypothetical protein
MIKGSMNAGSFSAQKQLRTLMENGQTPGRRLASPAIQPTGKPVSFTFDGRLLTGVGPEFSSQLIMLKESFRQVMIRRHEPGYIFRDLLPDGCVAFSPFPTTRGRCASPSALRVPGDAAASAYFIE